MENRIFLVTGAAGFLGSHVCDELLEQGERVRALVLPGDKSRKYIPSQVEIVEGNLCDMNSLEGFFTVGEGMQSIVIHCASLVTTDPGFSQKLIDVNVGGTKNMIEQCLKHPECQRMVYVSSTGAIPELPKGRKITEVRDFRGAEFNDKVVGWYSKSKAMATQAVLDACKNSGLNACVVHPSGILGPKDYAIGEVTDTVCKIMNGKMTVGMGGSFNLCDVRDLAHGCIAAAEKGSVGECYILGNEEVTLKELCKMLHDACGCKTPFFYVPISLSYRLAAQMEKKAAQTGEKPLMTNFAVYNLDRNNSFDYSKAQKELGYSTRPYAETLKDMAGWLVQQGLVKGTAKPTDQPEGKVESEKGMLTHAELSQIQRAFSGRELVRAVANAASAEELDALMKANEITGYSQKMLQECYTAVAMSRNRECLGELFQDRDFDRVSEKLASFGVHTSREKFNLINEMLEIGSDKALLAEVMAEPSVAKMAELFRARGYQAVNARFLYTLTENARTLLSDHLLCPEDLAACAGKSFQDCCMESLNTIMAMSAITELTLRLEGAVDPAYMIAIAGGMGLAYAR